MIDRRRSESISLGSDVNISVVEILVNKARIGIDAPTNISLHRLEIWEAHKISENLSCDSGNTQTSENADIQSVPLLSGDHRDIDVNEKESTTVRHVFLLRKDLFAEIRLPEDLTRAEASRLAEFVSILPLPDE